MFKLEIHSSQIMCTVVGIITFCNTNLQIVFHEYQQEAVRADSVMYDVGKEDVSKISLIFARGTGADTAGPDG